MSVGTISPSLSAAELADTSAEEALAFAAKQFAPLRSCVNPVVQQLLSLDFHEDWQVEAGRWLLFAQQHGFLDAALKNVLGAANAPPDPQNTFNDRFFRSFLARMAEPMAAYYFARTGWRFREWDPPRFRPAHDVDFIVGTPETIPRDVLVQVKAPDVAGPIVNYRAQGGDNDEHVWLAVAGHPQPDGTRKGGALGQLPRPAMTPSLIVVHANRHGKLSAEPRGIETKLMGSTLCFGGTKRVTLPRTRLGALFTDDWSHCSAVVLLDHLRSNEFFYACTVFLNPCAAEAARCAPEWFQGARVCRLDGETVRAHRWHAALLDHSGRNEARRRRDVTSCRCYAERGEVQDQDTTVHNFLADRAAGARSFTLASRFILRPRLLQARPTLKATNA